MLVTAKASGNWNKWI